jgi:hypothetical protein
MQNPPPTRWGWRLFLCYGAAPVLCISRVLIIEHPLSKSNNWRHIHPPLKIPYKLVVRNCIPELLNTRQEKLRISLSGDDEAPSSLSIVCFYFAGAGVRKSGNMRQFVPLGTDFRFLNLLLFHLLLYDSPM